MYTKTKSLRKVVKNYFPDNSDDHDNFDSAYRATQRHIGNIFEAFGVDWKKIKKKYLDQYEYKISEKAENIIIEQYNDSFPSKRMIKNRIDNRDDFGIKCVILLNEFIEANFYGERKQNVLNELKEVKENIENKRVKNYKELGIYLITINRELQDIDRLIYEYEYLFETSPSETEYGCVSKKAVVIIRILLALKYLNDYNKFLESTIHSIELIEKLKVYTDL